MIVNNTNNTNNNLNITNFIETIQTSIEKYSDQPHMLSKLNTYVNNLPNYLEQEHKKYNLRQIKYTDLQNEQDIFCQSFLNKYKYYYISYNSTYYEYTGKQYNIVNEDNIYHNLLSTITTEGKIIQWKHKTTQMLIKKIKEQSLFTSIPESNTIQHILQLFNSLFKTKQETKYFLAIIGDCILKKNQNNILYFVSSIMKKKINIIDSFIYITTGISISNCFISKYHETHQLSTYRIINTMDNVLLDNIKQIIQHSGIELLCVATHYSERFGSADIYLQQEMDNDIHIQINYLNINSIDNIVTDFIDTCIENTDNNTSINWKDIHYIWKLYLQKQGLPNILYINNIQNILMDKLDNTLDNDNIIFNNITSKYLPYISSFLTFWDKYITITNKNVEYKFSYEHTYELDEIITMYKHSDIKHIPISETNLINLINHYFPTLEIDNKWIYNINCSLWSKTNDIELFIQYYNQTNTAPISCEDLYKLYTSFTRSKNIVDKKANLIVSKEFFENYVNNILINNDIISNTN